MSAFKIETWLKKGFTEEEAKHKINIRRSTSIEFYQHKFGVDVETAKKMRDDRQIKSSEISSKRPKEEIRKSSVRCVEYWTSRGMTVEEALFKVSEVQSTFSLEKCIKKHGDIEGRRIFEERQSRWQFTLKNKNDDEIKKINEKKNIKKLDNWILKHGEEQGRKLFIDYIQKIRSDVVPLNIEELEDQIKKGLSVDDILMPPEVFAKKIPNYIWEIIPKPDNIILWLKSFIDFKHVPGLMFRPELGHRHYRMYVSKKLLRSKNEIYMYSLLTDHGLEHELDFEIEKCYPYSNMRSDFYLIKGEKYVELAGFKDMKYIQKMKYKEKTFNSIILYEKKEYQPFVEEYMITWYKK